jgi:hypothetical protein
MCFLPSRYIGRFTGDARLFCVLMIVIRIADQGSLSGRGRLEKELASQFLSDAGCFVPTDSVRDIVSQVLRDTSGCTHSARSHVADVNEFRIPYVHGLQLCVQRVGDGLEKQAMGQRDDEMQIVYFPGIHFHERTGKKVSLLLVVAFHHHPVSGLDEQLERLPRSFSGKHRT